MKTLHSFTILLIVLLSFVFSDSLAVNPANLGNKGNPPVYLLKQERADQFSKALIARAETYIGIKETKPNSSKLVDSFLSTVGLNPGYAWCAAFVHHDAKLTCKAMNVSTKLQKSASARMTFRLSKNLGIRASQDVAGQEGQIICFQKPNSMYGHIGIVTKRLQGNFVETIEGNTNSAGSRDGDGVYRKVRPIKGYNSLRVEGYLQFIKT